MLANNAVGRRLGWVQADGTPDPQEESGVPDWAVMGIVNSMALYVAPYFEKQPNPLIARHASEGMRVIMNRTAEAQHVQYPSRFPRGHANGSPYDWKYWPQANRIVTSNDYLTDEGDDPVTTP